MRNEPLITVGWITAVATAVLGLLTAFGADLTESQQVAVLGVVAVVAPLIVAFAARGRVTPNSKVAARKDGKPTD